MEQAPKSDSAAVLTLAFTGVSFIVGWMLNRNYGPAAIERQEAIREQTRQTTQRWENCSPDSQNIGNLEEAVAHDSNHEELEDFLKRISVLVGDDIPAPKVIEE